MVFHKIKDRPNLKYRDGVHRLNKKNLFGVKSWPEAEELFFQSLREIKRESDSNKKISWLVSVLHLEMGHNLTKNDLFEVLDFVGLKLSDLEAYILQVKQRDNQFDLFCNHNLKWYFEIMGEPSYMKIVECSKCKTKIKVYDEKTKLCPECQKKEDNEFVKSIAEDLYKEEKKNDC